jgi:hypothetical protein
MARPTYFLIDDDSLETYTTLDAEDLDNWAVLVNGAIVSIEADEEDCEIRIAEINREGDNLTNDLGFGAETQCDDGDDADDDQGGVWGDFDNTVGAGEWADKAVQKSW